MDSKEEIERIYRNIESYRSNAQKNKFYSMQRIDLIIVSLSTGSIIALLSKVELVVESLCYCYSLAYYISLVMIAVSIITNIISQIYSYKVHAIEVNWASQEMEIINNLRKENTSENSKTLNIITTTSNTISIVSLVVGIVISFFLLGAFILQV